MEREPVGANARLTTPALGTTVSDGRQLSHRWLAAKIGRCGLLPQHDAALGPKVKAWRFNEFKLGAATTRDNEGQRQRTLVKCPYDRSIITVVGPNLNRHEKAAGAITGRCAKPATSHQVTTEFVLPNTMLLE